jgi:natural product precursor
MKSLSNFSDSVLSRSEMKSVTGGCGMTCYFNGFGGARDGISNRPYSQVQQAVADCLAAGSGTRATWCCASC